MRKIIAVLFPWRQMFVRLELEKKWWHRFAVVLFFVILTFLSIASLFLTMSGTGPVNTVFQDARYWALDSAGNKVDFTEPPPNATQIVPATDEGEQGSSRPNLDMSKAMKIHSEIQMPNGETRESVGKSPKEIKTEWVRALRKERTKQVMLCFLITVMSTLVLGYLLQANYRVLLYVIYGPKVGTDY